MSDNEYFEEETPSRVIQGGLFPSSPRASRRESIFSDVIAEVLGADPSYSLEDLEDHIRSTESGPADEGHREQLLDVLDHKYVKLPRDTHKASSRALIPFDPTVAQYILPPGSSAWGRWYEMFVTESPEDTINSDSHNVLVDKLDEVSASNTFEEFIINKIEDMVGDDQSETGGSSLTPRRCYLPELASAFQRDVRAWSSIPTVTGSQWLLTFRDLVCFYCMMYYMQLARNLKSEWEEFCVDTRDSGWSPHVHELPFGIRTERAGESRDFRNLWEGSSIVPSMYDQLYESWMRLTVTRLLNDALDEQGITPDDRPFTMLEAKERLHAQAEEYTGEDDSPIEAAIKHLTSVIADSNYDDEPESLVDAAWLVFDTVDEYYRTQDSTIAAIRLGPAAVRQLGLSDERTFIEERQKAGLIFVLNEGSLAMFARIFTELQNNGAQDYSYSNFRSFLTSRGIKLKGESQAAAREMLEGMGLIRQESDSGDTINVRTH
ncbi:DNA phosphorothioation-dependent restriction protein DptG [Haloarcula sp. JP-L23]|uniref:DNA phosphorothioation-dependent restriction protein DptG n=1 Tax=Haloarcula sp. JP-L23 TaxID=2716717 RepID=UPI00140EBD83|nr:DNA phosphorothioation-dependent restriction protein DptG [Haloarcula sp. JP-L23]